MDREQSTAQQIKLFSQRPIENKSVSEVPGVGPRITEYLVANNIVQIYDLYNKLKKLDFDEEKFRVWLKLNVSHKANVSVIYKALIEWHNQSGAGEPHSDEEERIIETPERVVKSSRQNKTPSTESHRKSTPAIKRRKSSSDIAGAEVSALLDDTRSPSYHLIQYVASFFHIFRKIPEESHSAFRRDFLNLADKYEQIGMSKERSENESQPSTSNQKI